MLKRWISPLLLVVIWELVSRFHLVDPFFLPAPTTILVAAYKMIASGELIKHIKISLFRALSGYFIAVLVGIGLGIMVGWSKVSENIFDPLIELIRPIPTLALVPLIILWIGIGDLSKIIIVFKACLFPVLLNTIAGVKSVDKKLIQAARSLGAKDRQILMKVVIPSALPVIFTGIRISTAMCMMAIVGVEMIAAESGLGFLIVDMQRIFATDKMFVGIITLTLLGFFMDRIVRWVQKRVLKWHQDLSIGGEI
jgi:ABC-type nitrate/sulfonate/bicarbonate transport system permease component